MGGWGESTVFGISPKDSLFPLLNALAEIQGMKFKLSELLETEEEIRKRKKSREVRESQICSSDPYLTLELCNPGGPERNGSFMVNSAAE